MTFTHRVVTTVDMQYDLEKITLTAIILLMDFIVQAHLNNNLCVDVSLHLDTVS
jgi:hypothetical protein